MKIMKETRRGQTTGRYSPQDPALQMNHCERKNLINEKKEGCEARRHISISVCWLSQRTVSVSVLIACVPQKIRNSVRGPFSVIAKSS